MFIGLIFKIKLLSLIVYMTKRKMKIKKMATIAWELKGVKMICEQILKVNVRKI